MITNVNRHIFKSQFLCTSLSNACLQKLHKQFSIIFKTPKFPSSAFTSTTTVQLTADNFLFILLLFLFWFNYNILRDYILRKKWAWVFIWLIFIMTFLLISCCAFFFFSNDFVISFQIRISLLLQDIFGHYNQHALTI